MIEYKVVTTNVKNAEEEMNRLAQEGWQVVDTTTISGASFTMNAAPMIITFGRPQVYWR